jgi:hypothetical protein
VVRHFFGLRFVPVGKELSLSQQIERLHQPHFHFNVILVGADAFSTSEIKDVNRAVFDTREIYSKAGVSVGRVKWFAIPVSSAAGHEDIASDDEAVALTNSWSVHNNGLDVFVIRNGWSEDGAERAGLSDHLASCDKDADDSMSGSVVSVGGMLTGSTMAHEMGHDFGLDHIVELDPDELDEATEEQIRNLMFPFAITTTGELDFWQVVVILQHCLIRPPC